MRRGVWGALSAWQDDSGTQWVLVPFWGPVSTQFKAPIEHARPTGGGVAAFKLRRARRASGSSRRRGSRATWISPRKRSSPTASCSPMRQARMRRRSMPDAAWNEPGGPVYGGGLSSGPGAARAELAPRSALCARRPDRQGTVVERQPDRIVESLQRAHRRQRPRLHRDVRRRPLLLRGHSLTCSFRLRLRAKRFGETAVAWRRRSGGSWSAECEVNAQSP